MLPIAGGARSSDADFPFISERLRPDHDRTQFSSGRAELDDWFRITAAHADKAGNGRTIVWVNDASAVVAYYTLAPHAVRRGEAPAKVGRGSPDLIPSILLARLALAEDLHGQGFGEGLLYDALERALHGITVVGGRLVVVDALDQRAAAFYEKYGFEGTAADPGRLFIKASSAARTIGVGEWG